MKLARVKTIGGLISIVLLSSTIYLKYQEDSIPPLINSLVMEKRIAQVSNNLSGLVWDASTNTLLAVTNKPAQLIQLDKIGNVITRVSLPEIDDSESISLGWDNTYLIAEERGRKITAITLQLTDLKYQIQEPSLIFDLGGRKNEGIEGVAFSKSSGTIYVVNEKNPAVVFKIDGFNTPHHPLRIRKIYSSYNDISGLAWDDTRQRLYVLSDEAKRLLEMDNMGKIIRSSDLSDFTGVIPQPEGVAIHGDILYVVSEPNYFYVFDMVK